MKLILNWLKNKLINKDSGIIFDAHDSHSFSVIQDFIENYDRRFKTPIIYYEAFPEESVVEFLNTLSKELTSKLNKIDADPEQSLVDTIKDAELEMIIIDKCHLHPQDTMQNLINFFSVCGVAIILAGDRKKMAISQVLSNPEVANWDRLETKEKFEPVPELR